MQFVQFAATQTQKGYYSDVTRSILMCTQIPIMDYSKGPFNRKP